MKQILILVALVAFIWLGTSYVAQNVATPTVRGISVEPDLTIDGVPVTEVFAFSNAKIIDGDSLRISTADGNETDLRLAAIDAPESNQSFGDQAAQHLKNLTGRNEIIAWKIGADQYGRQLVFLFIEQPNGQLFEINSQMIRDGFAWHFKQYSSSTVLDSVENGARESRLGLWNDTFQPIPPWEFRNRGVVGSGQN